MFFNDQHALQVFSQVPARLADFRDVCVLLFITVVGKLFRWAGVGRDSHALTRTCDWSGINKGIERA